MKGNAMRVADDLPANRNCDQSNQNTQDLQ